MSTRNPFTIILTIVTVLSLTSIAGAAGLGDLLTDIAAYWNFDEGTGTTLLDSAGLYNYNGTLQGFPDPTDPSWQVGTRNTGLNFDGTDDTVAFGAGVLPDMDQMSLSVWVRNDVGSYFSILSTPGPAASGNIRFGIPGTDGQHIRAWVADQATDDVFDSVSLLPADNATWTHVAWTYDRNNEAKLYFDGVLDSTKVLDMDTAVLFSQGFNIGSWEEPGNYRWLNGGLDEMGIWNRVLDPGDVTNLYNGGSPVDFFISPGDVLHWDGDSGDWGDLAVHTTNSHWLIDGVTPTPDIPELGLPGTTGNVVVVGDGAVTVAADRGAYSLTIDDNGGGGGSVTINLGATLEIYDATTVTSPGALTINGTLDTNSIANDGITTLGAGSLLKTGTGALGTISTDGVSTVEVVSGLTAFDISMALGSTFVKAGGGSLTVTDAGVIDGTNTLQIDGGELKLQALVANPLGGAAVILGGGRLTT
ncbi:MAG: hypothetical protein QGG42_18845, partial [Phycisphaerae bacterium]|nr:hypothetical protein [Phycisphaerae bacterium]